MYLDQPGWCSTLPVPATSCQQHAKAKINGILIEFLPCSKGPSTVFEENIYRSVGTGNKMCRILWKAISVAVIPLPFTSTKTNSSRKDIYAHIEHQFDSGRTVILLMVKILTNLLLICTLSNSACCTRRHNSIMDFTSACATLLLHGMLY